MKIVFLGTNGWYSSFNNTICTLIETNSFYIILDAGDGLYKLDNYIDAENNKPVFLFLTHTHLDHIIGFHILSKFRFKQGIQIIGYKGTRKALSTIIRHPYTTPLANVPYNLEIFEFDQGTYTKPIVFTLKLLVHSDECVGYRLNIDKQIISYCTDTGVCEAISELSKDADLLISECSYKKGQEKWGWPHLKPEEIASIAKKAGVKKLIISHFDASIFKTMEDRKKAVVKAMEIFNPTIAAFDGFELVL